MQINKIDNTNFNGMYRMPNKPEYIKELLQHTIPEYQMMRKSDAMIFAGKNPMSFFLNLIMKFVAEKNNSSVEWLKMNAKNFGIDLYDLGGDSIHIVTTSKDINNAFDTILKSIEAKKPTLGEKIKNLFTKIQHEENIERELPDHLKLISAALKTEEKMNSAYSDLLNKEIEVSNPMALFKKLLMEKP